MGCFLAPCVICNRQRGSSTAGARPVETGPHVQSMRIISAAGAIVQAAGAGKGLPPRVCCRLQMLLFPVSCLSQKHLFWVSCLSQRQLFRVSSLLSFPFCALHLAYRCFSGVLHLVHRCFLRVLHLSCRCFLARFISHAEAFRARYISCEKSAARSGTHPQITTRHEIKKTVGFVC